MMEKTTTTTPPASPARARFSFGKRRCSTATAAAAAPPPLPQRPQSAPNLRSSTGSTFSLLVFKKRLSQLFHPNDAQFKYTTTTPPTSFHSSSSSASSLPSLSPYDKQVCVERSVSIRSKPRPRQQRPKPKSKQTVKTNTNTKLQSRLGLKRHSSSCSSKTTIRRQPTMKRKKFCTLISVVSPVRQCRQSIRNFSHKRKPVFHTVHRRKTSTLDFRCVGAELEEEKSMSCAASSIMMLTSSMDGLKRASGLWLWEMGSTFDKRELYNSSSESSCEEPKIAHELVQEPTSVNVSAL